MNNYTELLKELADHRQAAVTLQESKKKLLDCVKESREYLEIDQKHKDAQEKVDRLEAEIKALAEKEYQTTGNKKPHEKVQVKIFKVFKILDAETMKAWVFKNLQDALKVDEAKVKDYAQKIGAVQGTEVAEEARAQIASTL